MLTTAKTTIQSSAATHTTLGSVRFSVPQILRWCKGWHLYVSRHVLLHISHQWDVEPTPSSKSLKNPTEGYVEAILGNTHFIKKMQVLQPYVPVLCSLVDYLGAGPGVSGCLHSATAGFLHVSGVQTSAWGQALSLITIFLTAQMQQRGSASWMLTWKQSTVKGNSICYSVFLSVLIFIWTLRTMTGKWMWASDLSVTVNKILPQKESTRCNQYPYVGTHLRKIICILIVIGMICALKWQKHKIWLLWLTQFLKNSQVAILIIHKSWQTFK